jgi:uncharacterized phage protein (predicted DNA packaging)
VITLKEIKAHLNLEEGFTADDPYLLSLIKVSTIAVERHIDRKLNMECDPNSELIKHAIKIMVANLYANREPVGTGTVVNIPYTFEYLIGLCRNYNYKKGIKD